MILLSIISIFIIGIISFTGTQISNLFFKKNYYLDNLKNFSNGIIISTGFIHMLTDAQLDLENIEIDYPLCNLIVGLTIILIIILEDNLFYLIKLNYNNKENLKEDINIPTINEHEHKTIIDKELCDMNICDIKISDNEVYNNNIYDDNLININNHNLKIKDYIIIHLLEFGITIHSIIIGISLGILEDLKTKIILLIIITFHQFFEGISIGNGLLKLNDLTMNHYCIMIIIFVLTTPLGIVIGILISQNYEENYLITGILNSISAGLLIYIGLYNIIKNNSNTLYTQLSLFLGFSFMAILGIWG